jgi:hypothetical protein
LNFFGNLGEENSKILFFILVFLILFESNFFGSCGFDDDPLNRDTTILFFIIIFLLLFNNFNSDRGFELPPL